MATPETPFGAPPQSGESTEQEVSVLYLPSLEEMLGSIEDQNPAIIFDIVKAKIEANISRAIKDIKYINSRLQVLEDEINSQSLSEEFINNINIQINLRREIVKTLRKKLKDWETNIRLQLDAWYAKHLVEDSQNPNTDTTVQDLIKYHESKSPNDIKKSVEEVIESTVESYIGFNSNRGIAADDEYIKDWKTARLAEIDAWYEQQIAKTNSNANLPFAQTIPHTIVQEFIEFFGDLSPEDIKESVKTVIESTVESYLKFNSNRGLTADKVYIEDWKTARTAEIDAWYKWQKAVAGPESDLKTIPFGGYMSRFIEKARLRDSKSPQLTIPGIYDWYLQQTAETNPQADNPQL